MVFVRPIVVVEIGATVGSIVAQFVAPAIVLEDVVKLLGKMRAGVEMADVARGESHKQEPLLRQGVLRSQGALTAGEDLRALSDGNLEPVVHPIVQ